MNLINSFRIRKKIKSSTSLRVSVDAIKELTRALDIEIELSLVQKIEYAEERAKQEGRKTISEGHITDALSKIW